MGKPKSWRTGLECQENCGGITVSGHFFRNTTIKLATADQNFTNNILSIRGATTSGIQSYDGGVTWVIPKIYIPEISFGPL
jgi:hypothetical protein